MIYLFKNVELHKFTYEKIVIFQKKLLNYRKISVPYLREETCGVHKAWAERRSPLDSLYDSMILQKMLV
jgi:hypothetical protein